ncbi:hypothetical protein [Pseudomonas sp. FEN]|uniref:hypothetical protein n=1 Tax=Pseudomonas sp. FEN TaxID=2767468 RepID=UPI00174DBAF5|nr:hypothetical protein [Pseudomonas sp. FEN]
MNNSELGRVQAFLLKHRIAETKAARRNISREEREVATILRDADPQMRTLLEEILDGQGLVLQSFREFDVAGIPAGAMTFVLARKPDTNPPFFGTERLISRMKQLGRYKVSDTEIKIWFTQLWFVLLDLLYTKKNRSPGAMQDWVDTAFNRLVFTDAVKNYINDSVLKMDPASLKTTAIYDALTSTKEGTITQLCSAFLEIMQDASLLERLEEDVYRQSLLFAFEMKMNYDRQLVPLLPALLPFDAASAVLIEEVEEVAHGNNH